MGLFGRFERTSSVAGNRREAANRVSVFSWFQRKKPRLNDADDPLVGKVVGDYCLIRRLGKAGLSWIYEAQPTAARQAKESAQVHLLGEPGEIERRRFHREIQILRALVCEGLPRLLDFGEDYFVCAAISGRPLKPALPWSEVARIGREIACTLDILHQKGFVHYNLGLEQIWSDGTHSWLMSLSHARRMEQAQLMASDKPIEPAQDQLELGLALTSLGDYATQPVLARMLQADPAARFPNLAAVADALS